MVLFNFLGHNTILHGTRAPEFVSAARDFGGGGDTFAGPASLEFRRQAALRSPESGDQGLPLAGRTPACLAASAARLYSTLRNITHDDRVGSPFAHRHSGNAFAGPLIPFGALVCAMPSALHKKRSLKFEPELTPAVLLGHVMQDGGTWSGEYLLAFVEDPADEPFWSRSRWAECRVTVLSGRELRDDPK